MTSTITSLVDYTVTREATLTDGATATETLSVTATLRPCDNSPEQQCNAGARCPGSTCFCERTDLGQRCVNGDRCGTACTTSDDCTRGFLCTFNTCCSQRPGSCLRIGAECLNPVLVSRIFRLRSAEAGLKGGNEKGEQVHNSG